jgi:hypothetical protein
LLWSVYSLRNLWARRVTTLLTLSGLGLVVFVFVAILMLAHGLERTMGRTGDPANAILFSKGALSEIESSLSRDQTGVLAAQPDVVTLGDHQVAAVREIALQLTLRKQDRGAWPVFPYAALRPSRLPCVPACASYKGGVAARHHGGDCRQPGGQAVSRSPAG